MRQLLVVGNWKMNGSRASVQALLGDLLRAAKSFRPQVVVCPTYVHLAQALELCAATSISVGAQDCSHRQSGAYTGEVAPGMLAELGCRWVILGHSERRQYHGESDALVAAKLTAAVEAGLQPIVCVGETREQREHPLVVTRWVEYLSSLNLLFVRPWPVVHAHSNLFVPQCVYLLNRQWF
mgnify:CR=1 FL=1